VLVKEPFRQLAHMPLYWEKQDNVALPLDSMGIMSYPFQSRWQIYIYIYIYSNLTWISQLLTVMRPEVGWSNEANGWRCKLLDL